MFPRRVRARESACGGRAARGALPLLQRLGERASEGLGGDAAPRAAGGGEWCPVVDAAALGVLGAGGAGAATAPAFCTGDGDGELTLWGLGADAAAPPADSDDADSEASDDGEEEGTRGGGSDASRHVGYCAARQHLHALGVARVARSGLRRLAVVRAGARLLTAASEGGARLWDAERLFASTRRAAARASRRSLSVEEALPAMLAQCDERPGHMPPAPTSHEGVYAPDTAFVRDACVSDGVGLLATAAGRAACVFDVRAGERAGSPIISTLLAETREVCGAGSPRRPRGRWRLWSSPLAVTSVRFAPGSDQILMVADATEVHLWDLRNVGAGPASVLRTDGGAMASGAATQVAESGRRAPGMAVASPPRPASAPADDEGLSWLSGGWGSPKTPRAPPAPTADELRGGAALVRAFTAVGAAGAGEDGGGHATRAGRKRPAVWNREMRRYESPFLPHYMGDSPRICGAAFCGHTTHVLTSDAFGSHRLWDAGCASGVKGLRAFGSFGSHCTTARAETARDGSMVLSGDASGYVHAFAIDGGLSVPEGVEEPPVVSWPSQRWQPPRRSSLSHSRATAGPPAVAVTALALCEDHSAVLAGHEDGSVSLRYL